jgi:beta-phosphoglucomutase-like phosphatase (HAD superfamily)
MAHIIFDCDGVLVDSEAISMSIDAKLLNQNGIAITEDEMHARFVGATFEAMVSVLAAEHDVVLPGDLELQKDHLMAAQYKAALPIIEGLNDSLFLLKDRGHRFSIGSNGPKHRIHLALGILGLENVFDDIVTFEDVINPKPAPDIYLLAAQRAGHDPRRVIVVEDSPTGMRAAVASGARCLGFVGTHAHPNEQAERLRAAGAESVFHHMRDLPSLVSA